MSRTVVLYGTPPPVEEEKDADTTLHIDGAGVVVSQMLGAMLEYGSADRYYVMCKSAHEIPVARRVLAAHHHGARAEIVSTDGLHRLTERDDVVMQMNHLQLYGLGVTRDVIGRPRWPVVGLIHNLSYQDFPAYPLIALATLFTDLKPHDCIVCTSTAGRRAIERLRANVVEAIRSRWGFTLRDQYSYAVIPLGVNTAAFATGAREAARRAASLPADGVILMYFGRFAPDSKIDLFPLILAFAQVIADRRHRGAELPWLLLAGDDQEHQMTAMFEQFAAEVGVADRVIIRPDPNRAMKAHYYASADVFVSPSDNPQETFGITIIEAMAAGLPVIASDWDGYRDHIRHGVDGFLVPTYWPTGIDYISKFAVARKDRTTHRLLSQSVAVDPGAQRKYIETLVDAPAIRRDMGVRAQQKARAIYDWRVVVHAYEQLWAEQTARAARDHGQAEGPPPCWRTDFFRTFGGYASDVVPPHARIRLPANGMHARLPLSPQHPLAQDVGVFQASDARRLLELAAEDNGWSCETLACQAAAEVGHPPELLLQHVARLLKYGLLELTPGTLRGSDHAGC